MTYTLDSYFKDAGLRMTVPFAPYIQMNPTKLPMKHQISGLNKLLKEEYYGLYDEPGTGKTMQSHAAFLYWVSEGQRCIAVMPPNLIYQYNEELYSMFWEAEKYVTTHVLDQEPKQRRELYAQWEAENNWPQMLVMSYEMFAREYDTLMDKYRFGVFDEAHNLKNSNSAIYKKVKEWQEQKGGTAGVFMTGTPTHNELIDCFALTELTSPGTYRGGLDRWVRRYRTFRRVKLNEPRRLKNGKMQKRISIPTGYRHIAEIKKKLYAKARRVQKRKIMDAAPEPVIIEVAVKLDGRHLNLYKKLTRERLLEVGDEMIIAANAQALRQKCLQLVTSPELFVEEWKWKNKVVETVQTLINGINLEETKVILFCNYQDSVRTLASYFEEYKPALMYGDSNNEKARQQFLKDDECRVLIANPVSAGVGYNFQEVCHDVIFVEPTSVPGDFKQAMARVDRTGQRHLVNVWILKAMNTIAPKATKDMLRKEETAQEVYEDKFTFLKDFQAA